MFPFPPFALPAKNLIRDLWFCGLLAWNDLLEMPRPAGRSPELGRRNDRNSDYRPPIAAAKEYAAHPLALLRQLLRDDASGSPDLPLACP